MVETVFREEDPNNLKTLAEELPMIRLLLEELAETLEVLEDEELMESIKASERDIQEGKLIGFDELLKELDIDEQEV